MGWRFNPAPGWQNPPPGVEPQPGWQPDPSWPPAPPGWQVWVWVDDVPLWWDQTVASRPSLDEPPLPAGGGARVPPGGSETDYLTKPTSADSQYARADQRGSLVATAVTSVCLAYFTNATTALMGRNALIWAAFITIGGLGIGLLFRFVLTPSRLRAVAAKLGRRQHIPHSPVLSSPGISDRGGYARLDYRSRRVSRVLAAVAVMLLLGAFVLLQLSLSVTVVTMGILALLVGITFLPSGWIVAARQVVFNVGSSVVCITLTLGSLAVANGILNPGALAGAWRSASWVVVRDDPHVINLAVPTVWELAVKGSCLGQRCDLSAQARGAGARIVIGPVALKPGADGSYSRRLMRLVDCVETQDRVVVVSKGYNWTTLYRLKPGPYVGLPGRQRPTTFTIEITDTAKSTPEGKAKNCPDTFEVYRGTAERQ